ncbi:MAG: hypothetical protein AAFZ04_04850 [Pseudomonadota bacterium]
MRCLCATALLALPAMAQDIPTPATATDLFDRFADTTQTLEDGLAYYAASGVLLVVRDGKMTPGKWVGHDDGRLCWVLKEQDEACTDYVILDKQVFINENGFIGGKPNLEAGNILAERASAQAFAESVDLFTRDQTIALLSDKTALRAGSGRMYYGPDFILRTNWNGVQKVGTWSVNEQGGVCWHVTGWGTHPCEYYFTGQNGDVWSRYRGLDRTAAELVDGDQTGN